MKKSAALYALCLLLFGFGAAPTALADLVPTDKSASDSADYLFGATNDSTNTAYFNLYNVQPVDPSFKYVVSFQIVTSDQPNGCDAIYTINSGTSSYLQYGGYFSSPAAKCTGNNTIIAVNITGTAIPKFDNPYLEIDISKVPLGPLAVPPTLATYAIYAELDSDTSKYLLKYIKLT